MGQVYQSSSSSASYRVTPNLATAETPFFLFTAEIQTYHYINFWNNATILGAPDSGLLNLEAH